MKKVMTLYNDFHNTEVNLRVGHIGEIEVNDLIEISENQVKKAKKILCCKDCICSNSVGIRAEWHKLGSEEVKLSSEEIYDSKTGKIVGYQFIVDQVW